MFICRACLEDCEGPPIAWAKASVEAGLGSRGPCEFCGKTAVCADVPSSASWTRTTSERREP